MMFDTDLEPPYYAVIFSSERNGGDEGYSDMAASMLALAARQPGFLGVDSARDPGLGITVSYWRDLESIRAWREHADHLEAQRLGRERWYRRYTLRVARVERSSTFEAEGQASCAGEGMPTIRLATADDAHRLATIFYDSIHNVACRDYSRDQLNAWAPQVPETEWWTARLGSRTTFVAELNGRIVGFGELEADGHIDGFYCASEHQRQGVGSAILRAIEQEAISRGLPRLFAEVSITARPFFEAKGFRLVREQTVERRGIALVNFIMDKRLGNQQSR